MDIQKLVDVMNETASRERGRYHLTLGTLVAALEGENADMPVIYDMPVTFGRSGKVYPSAPDSYRGYYSDLSFPPSDTPITVGELLREAKDAIGSTFEGYKGGDFTMDAETPLWASPYGSANGIAVMQAEIVGDQLVLRTKQLD